MASGNISRSRGKWRARWREHPGAPERSANFERKVEAQAFLAKTLADLQSGTWIDPNAGRVTFQEWAEDWRTRQQHRPGTAAQVESQLRIHVYPVIGAMPIATVRRSHVEALVKRIGETLAPSTTETVYRHVAAVFGAAVRDRLIPSTPCDRIRLPKADRAKVIPLEGSEVEAILEAIGDRYRALVVLAAGTGLRQGECFGLTVDRVDFLRNQVRVDRQRNPIAASPELFAPTKTAASNRVLPLPETVKAELAAHLARYGTGSEGLIFTTEDGQPLQRNRWGDRWQAMRRRAVGLRPGVKFHDLRHFYASALIRHGESVKVVQARLGHASAAETLDTYSHLWPDADDQTRAAIDLVLGPIAGQSRDAAAG